MSAVTAFSIYNWDIIKRKKSCPDGYNLRMAHHMKASETYSKHILDNGLTVLLKEIHSAPLISHWLWYRVGSRLEQPGLTGTSHWVEHMQFKGTVRYPDGVPDREISRAGGLWNAFTYLDWTAFYETLPADRISLAIDIEADRMSNSLFDPEEVESERTVILSEREGSENDPTFRLRDAILKTAFPNHPYRHEVIGETEDLQTITRDDLYTHYRKHYAPNNAVLVMAGDFETEDMLKRLESAYRDIPARPIPEYSIEPEKMIAAPQTVEEHGPADVTILQMVWRAPAGRDPDIFPLAVFDSVLSGPSSLNMFGKGHISNRTSRLYRSLVQSGKAAGIGGGYVTTIDPYLYNISAYMPPGKTPKEAIEAIRAEIADIAGKGITDDELNKARKQAKAMFAYSCENITNQAYWLGYSSMFADPGWYTNYLRDLEKVTAEDVSRIAQQYFSPDHCVTGIYSSN